LTAIEENTTDRATRIAVMISTMVFTPYCRSSFSVMLLIRVSLKIDGDVVEITGVTVSIT